MRNHLVLFVAAVTVVAATPAFADLQNVTVGGAIRIRGNWYSSEAAPDSLFARNPLIQSPWARSLRPLGNPFSGLRWGAQPGSPAVWGGVDWDEDGPSDAWVEQRTTLSVKADFTDEVSALIALDSYDVWGEDFRSNYFTGVDGRANTGDDVEVYQAYIEANEMFGYPLRLRIGRQELLFGSGWLVGPNDTAALYYGTSFDAIRATYATDMFTVDAVWAKLVESGPVEEDGDVDLYALYGSYLGLEDISIDAYWIWVRDATARGATYSRIVGGWIEDLLDVDDYDVTNLHTIGLRGAGALGAFDFEAEAAYQFGDADAVSNVFFQGAGISPYGADDTDWDNWACNIEVGYTFDIAYEPRVYLGLAYFGGEDNRDVNFWNWLGAVACPFWSMDESVSFNRLFSNWEYSEFLANTDLSNVWVARGGVSVCPTENIEVLLAVSYFETLEAYHITWPAYFLLGNRVTWFAPLSFIDQEVDDELGWEIGLYVLYDYSEDLSFEVGYAHFFTGDAFDPVGTGHFINGNGLLFNGGTSDDDADYVYFETKLCF